MRFVAFVRNLNQGQRGHSSTSDLVAAFARAGYAEAVTFQSNGTVVFEDASADHALAGVQRAQRELAEGSGVEREIFVIPLDKIVAITEAHALAPDAARRELTLHVGNMIDVDDPAVVSEAAHRRCRVLAAGEGWAISTNERDRESNATPVIERLTGAPATSRGLSTLVRLVDRFASDSPTAARTAGTASVDSDP